MDINIDQLRAYESDIITSFLDGNDMDQREEKKFIDSFKLLKDEEKGLALHRMASMLPQFRELLEQKDQGMNFNMNPMSEQPQQAQQVPVQPEQGNGQNQQAQQAPTAPAQNGGLILDNYLAQLDGNPEQLDLDDFRDYLNNL